MKNNLYNSYIKENIMYIRCENTSISLPITAIQQIEETKNCYLINTEKTSITVWKEITLIFTTIME